MVSSIFPKATYLQELCKIQCASTWRWSSMWVFFHSHVAPSLQLHKSKKEPFICMVRPFWRVDWALWTVNDSHQDTRDLRACNMIHITMKMKKGMVYKKNQKKQILFPERFWSIIVDGTSQSGFGLRHFVSKSKKERIRALRSRSIVLIEHKKSATLYLHNDIGTRDESNHILETVERFIADLVPTAPLPPTLYVQGDYCTREKKCGNMFVYMESRLAWKMPPLLMYHSCQLGVLPKTLIRNSGIPH